MAEGGRWRVLLLDTKRSNPNHYICLSLEEALRAHPQVACVHRASMGNALRIAQSEACNLFLAFDGEELHRGICERLAQVCGRSVLWVTEDPYELPVNVANAGIFDVVLTNDSASVGAYAGRAHHLPLAGSPSLQYRPVQADADCMYDLFFAGSAWPNRVELLRQISGSIEGLKAKLALSTNPHLPPVDLALPVSAWNWRTPNSEFARLANRSRVVLTLHRDFSANPGGRATAATPGPRLFEVALAGGFQLVDGSLPEVARYLEPGKEIAVFHNAAECVDQLRFHLAHPAQRVEMALAAQQRVLQQHTYLQRVDVILQLAAQQPQDPAAGQITVRSDARPRVLTVTHNMIGGLPWGGVEVYQEWVRKSLAADFDVWTYSPVAGTDGQAYVLLDGGLSQVERIECAGPAGPELLSSSERETAFSRLLQQHGFAVVHFQHLLHQVPSLPLIASALGIPTLWSLHDYYGLCHQFNLLGADGRYCEVERQTEAGCDLCLGQSMNAQRGSQARRRSFYRRALESATILHANTDGVRRRHEAIYGTLSRHAGWEVMGVPIAPSHAGTVTRPPRNPDRLKVAIPGNFVRHKGAELIVQALRQMREEPVDFVILGRVDGEWPQRLRDTGNKQVTVHGAYDPANAEDLLRDADVSLHLSIWPETYCLTLSESFRAGLVPVVTDIGALGERVRHGVNGLKFPPQEPGRLVELLTELSQSPQLLERLRSGVTAADFVEHETHLGWLRAAYHRLARMAPQPKMGSVTPLTLAECGVVLNEPIWLTREGDVPGAPRTPAAARRESIPVRILLHVARHGVGATLRRASRELVSRVRHDKDQHR